MSVIGPSDVEIRVLGCLIEKQRATPNHYPLTLNSLRLACNQSTNREPVVEYDEATIREALGRLGRRRWIRSASGHTSRAAKYRHLLEEEMKLSGEELSLLAVLMLRGPQTPGELKQRSERLYAFESLDEVQLVLDDLIERRLVERLERRPGQKEVRYRQLLGGDEDDEATEQEGHAEPAPAAVAQAPAPQSIAPAPQSIAPAPATPVESGLAERVARLEDELAALRRQVEELRARLDV